MFSCCALFNTEDNGPDVEHLKALEELEMPSPVADGAVGDDASVGLNNHVVDESVAMAPSLDASAELPQEAGAGSSPVVKKLAVGTPAASGVGSGMPTPEGDAHATREENEQTDDALRALKDAQDAAAAAAAEAERRRFEEEASARAARQAESEARKAMWRAEEAQRMKEEEGVEAHDGNVDPAQVTAQQKAKAAAASTAAVVDEVGSASGRKNEARNKLAERLIAGGVRLQKHGRNGRTTRKTLITPGGDMKSITWGRVEWELKTMQEVRRGTDSDPATPGSTGTQGLRRSKKPLEQSFSLVFPSRSLDFTASSKEECDELVQGFRALRPSDGV